MNSVATTTLQITRFVKASRERVFAAWTKPVEILKWFGPGTCHALSAKFDLRVGGSYLIRMKTEPFGELEISGVYREVIPASKLVFTWNWKGHPEMEMPETLVTVEFMDKGGGSEMRLTHEWFQKVESRNNHTEGWSGGLDKLETLFGAGSCQTAGTFCWNEMIASDTASAAKFYSQLFGWKSEPAPGPMPYFLFKKGDNPVSGLMQCMKEGVRPHWLAYVSVEDAEASARQAGALGATIVVTPTDIPGVGKIAVFVDPQGAALGLFQPAFPPKT